MEKENIITVDIEDFKDSQHVLDYIDDDFAIVNSLEGTPYSNDTIKLNCFLIAVCIEGCIQLDVNYRTYKLQAGELLLGLPNTIISHTMLSPKYKVRLAGFSTRPSSHLRKRLGINSADNRIVKPNNRSVLWPDLRTTVDCWTASLPVKRSRLR